jgi:NAD(P)-dependent dehydrogenase (short-subunit alcohol dehydrogenase family)
VDLDLANRVAVITGCSVGIGRGIAKVLASEGVQTVVIARRGELLASLQDEVEASGGLRPSPSRPISPTAPRPKPFETASLTSLAASTS